MRGIGIDLTEVARIKKSMENPRFLSRFFGKEERALFVGAHAAERAAAHFAAKEAFGKAMGIGIRGFSLAEVQVLRDERGAPYLSFSGSAAQIVKERGLSFFCSITHTAQYAQAIVVAQEENAC